MNDATKDERFFDNPLVTGDLNLVFYAGAPLISSEGHALGTLCIIDTKSRKFESDQQRQLQIFARQISNIIETGYVSDESRVETNRKIEVYFEKCFSNSPASVYIVDKDGYVKAASDAYLEFVGLSNTEIIGKAAVQFLAPESRAEFTDKWLPLLKKNGKFTGFRCQWLRKKREAFGVLMSATAELDEDGEIIQSMVVVAEIGRAHV